MRPLTQPLILSVSGRDRTGLLAAMAGALDRAGIDIVDIEQATLQDFLALSFLIDLENDAPRAQRLLNEVLPRAAELGLAVDVRALDADQVRLLKESDRAVLTVVSERPSSRLVAELGEIASRHGANIVSIRRLAEEDLRAGEYVLDITRVPERAAMKAEFLQAARRLGMDLGLAREDAYRTSKRLVVFDMDGTLVVGETIEALAERAGAADAVARITALAMEGRLDFAASLRERAALLAGLPASVMEEVARDLRLAPGAEEAVATLKGLGYKVGVLSGGFLPFALELERRLGLDYAEANRPRFADGVFTGEVEDPILDGEGKARRLVAMAGREGISLDQVVGVGDGANDIPMLQAAGLGIAFRAKEATRRSADAAIERRDFLGLLYLMGVSGRDLKRAR